MLGKGHGIGDYKHLMQRVDVKQLDALFEAPAQAEAAPATPNGSAGRRGHRPHHHD